MKKLETIENEVKKILDKDIRARKDDMYLYYMYCTKYGVLNEKAFVQLFYSKNFRYSYSCCSFLLALDTLSNTGTLYSFLKFLL